MRRAHRLLLLLAAAVAPGCGDAPEPAPAVEGAPPAAPEVDEEAAAARRLARAAAARMLPALLPIRPAEVEWFEVRRADEARALEAAMLAVPGPGGRPCVEAVGLGGGEDPLRLWRTEEEIWVLPGDALGAEVGPAAYRAWTPDATWEDPVKRRQEPVEARRGRRLAPEIVETRAGSWRCVRTEHARAGDVVVRHSFAPERGLVRLEVLVGQETRLRLDLVDVARRGRPPEGYDVATPQGLWRSVRAAYRAADVEGLDRLQDESLRGRGRRSVGDRVRGLLPPDQAPDPGDDSAADLARARLGELIALEIRVRTAFVVNGDEATATALVRLEPESPGGRPATVRGQVVLARQTDGTWRWHDLRLPAR